MSNFLETKPPARYFVEEEWIKQNWTPINPNFEPSAPGNRYWYGCLLGSLGHEYIKEDCVMLDYGCGNAPLAVFISGKLKQFTYYGVEPEGSPFINFAPQAQNIHVGYIGSKLEQDAIEQAQCATLGSVFTHLEWRDSCEVLDKLHPIIKRGAVVFSCFISDKEGYIGPNHYPHSSVPTYHYSFITKPMIQAYAQSRDLKWEVSNTYYSLGVRLGVEVIHRFIKLTMNPVK